MGMLETRGINKNTGVKKNSAYDKRKRYTQRELDEYRISEGYTKEDVGRYKK